MPLISSNSMVPLLFYIFFIVKCVFMSGNQRSYTNTSLISKTKNTIEVKSEIDIHAPNEKINIYPETIDLSAKSTCSSTDNTELMFYPLGHNDSIGINVNHSIDVDSCMSSNDLACNEVKNLFYIPMSKPRINTDYPSCSKTKIPIKNNKLKLNAIQYKKKSMVLSSEDPIYPHQTPLIDKYKARIIKRIFGPIAE